MIIILSKNLCTILLGYIHAIISDNNSDILRKNNSRKKYEKRKKHIENFKLKHACSCLFNDASS